MIRSALLAVASLSAMPARAADAPPVVGRINAAPARDGWFVCDAIDGPYAAFAGVPDAGGTSVITLLDRRTGSFDTQSYQVGRGDPGAGQIYWSLSRAGHPVGSVHGVNPAMVEGGGLPPITSLAIDGKSLECRWLAQMRFLGLDSRRSVVVTEGAGGLTYRSFDFRRRGAITHPDGVQRSNVPTLTMTGGTESAAGFRFANAGYVYAIARPATDAATVKVTRGGRQIGIDTLVGFGFAPPASTAPSVAALGPDAVWAARDIDACRAKTPAAAIDTCLVETMRRTDATPAAIAFTRQLIAGKASGYISGWKQVGPIGIATVTYPFRANSNQGTVLIPTSGDPIDVDAWPLSAADTARADYRAAQAQHPDAFPVPPGDVAIGKAPGGGPRILVTTRTADCHACAPNGSIVVAFDFDAAGHFLGAGLVLAA